MIVVGAGFHRHRVAAFVMVASLLLLPGRTWSPSPVSSIQSVENALHFRPTFEVDPNWPLLPKGYEMGDVSGVHVDSTDHVWLLHRQALALFAWGDRTEEAAKLWTPPVMVFNASNGAFLTGWGGPGVGYDWPESEHSLQMTPDEKGVWIHGGFPVVKGHLFDSFFGGSPPLEEVHDRFLVKFDLEGNFLKQIGTPYKGGGNEDTRNLNRPADSFIDAATDELFVADGHGNKRIIVYDATTGEFKRMWGAYGKPPPQVNVQDDLRNPVFADFGHVVHCIVQDIDSVIYVCDRDHGRVQMFMPNSRFVNELWIDREPFTDGGALSFNGPWDVAFSRDSHYMYISNGKLGHVHIYNRKTLELLHTFGQLGHEPGQFRNTHSLSVDSQDNLFVTETGGKPCRAQKFVFKGLVPI